MDPQRTPRTARCIPSTLVPVLAIAALHAAGGAFGGGEALAGELSGLRVGTSRLRDTAVSGGAARVPRLARASERAMADGKDAADSSSANPVEVIRRLQAALLDYMQAADETPAEVAAEEEALISAIRRTHDFPYIARIALGRHWRSLDAARREAYVERFEALSLATYTDRFADFRGSAFEITDDAESAFGQHRVEATLVTEDGQHDFEYLLRRDDDGDWRIVNIIVDGVSDLALRRAEYARVWEQSGYEGLMDELERQRRNIAEADSDG